MRSLSISRGDTEGDINLRELINILTLPSLRKLEGWGVSIDDFEWPSDTFKSNLEVVEFDHACLADPAGMRSFLGPLHHLHQLRLIQGDSNDLQYATCSEWELRELSRILNETVHETLEHLSLGSQEALDFICDPTTSLGSLTSLTKLKMLEIDTECLRNFEPLDDDDDAVDQPLDQGFYTELSGSEDREMVKLVDVLPPSIEVLTLFVRDASQATGTMTGLAKAKPMRFPNLREIVIDGMVISKEMNEELRNAGIEILWKWKSTWLGGHLESNRATGTKFEGGIAFS